MGGAWTKKVIGVVAAGVGKVVRIDARHGRPGTYEGTWVLVSVKAKAKLAEEVWLEVEGKEMKNIDIKYEWIPP